MIVQEGVYLEHYGKKGMKWGKRKTTSADRSGVNGPYRKSSKTQSRKARNGKRVLATVLGGPIGLVGYNALAKPLNTKDAKKMAAKKQSGTAFAAKLVATGVLTSPVGAIAYAQSAKRIDPKK